MIKKKLIVGITRLFFLFILWQSGSISFEIGKEKNIQETPPHEIVITTTGIENIPGTLLISPNTINRDTRAKTTEETPHLRGRLYHLTLKNAKELFKTMAIGGKDIDLIIENQKYQQFTNDFKNLVSYYSGTNVEIKDDKKLGVTYTHAKTFFGDSFFIIETANLTQTSFTKNIEHIFIGTNTGIINNLNILFQKDWNGEKIAPSDIHPNLLVCPINCRTVLEFMLSHAEKSIRMYQQYISDPAIAKILKKNNQKDLRFLLPETIDNKKTKKIFGQENVKLLKKPYIHSKTILIDDAILLLGSANMSTNSLDNNREIGIIITDPSVIAVWKEEFLLRREK